MFSFVPCGGSSMTPPLEFYDICRKFSITSFFSSSFSTFCHFYQICTHLKSQAHVKSDVTRDKGSTSGSKGIPFFVCQSKKGTDFKSLFFLILRRFITTTQSFVTVIRSFFFASHGTQLCGILNKREPLCGWFWK